MDDIHRMDTRAAVVFVVDDDADGRDITKYYLKRKLSHVSVIDYSSAESVLMALEDRHPDLLVTDHTLPRMSGVELVKEIRRRGFRFPVVVFSGLDTIEEPAIAAGANEFVSTGRAAELGQIVAKWLLAGRANEIKKAD